MGTMIDRNIAPLHANVVMIFPGPDGVLFIFGYRTPDSNEGTVLSKVVLHPDTARQAHRLLRAQLLVYDEETQTPKEEEEAPVSIEEDPNYN